MADYADINSEKVQVTATAKPGERFPHSVGCNDCKWQFQGDIQDWCWHPAVGRREWSVNIGVHCSHLPCDSPDAPNANGDCPYYRRKWWKFGRPK